MTRTQRLVWIALALVVLVAAFVLIRPGDDDDPTPEPVATTTPAGTATPAPDSGEPATTPTAQPTRTPDPTPLLRPGRVEEIEVEHGDIVRFRVRSPTAEELHVHGYDILREVPPGRTVSVSFEATIEGIFEIELEHSGEPVRSWPWPAPSLPLGGAHGLLGRADLPIPTSLLGRSATGRSSAG
jgi:hypothetical protein